MRPLGVILLSVGVVTAGLAIYHLVISDAAMKDDVHRLEQDVSALREDVQNARGGAATLRRLIALETRLDALGRSDGDAGLDLDALESMLEQLEARAMTKRSAAQTRRRLVNGGVVLGPEDEQAVLPVITRYTTNLLKMRDRMRTAGPREVVRGAREAHARMSQELRALLPATTAERIIELYPAPPEPKGPPPGGAGGG
jgi:hypothetical protein